MRIKEVAQAVGVSPEWLRRLEKAGRIPAPPRDVNGVRRYAEEDVQQIRRILMPSAAER